MFDRPDNPRPTNESVEKTMTRDKLIGAPVWMGATFVDGDRLRDMSEESVSWNYSTVALYCIIVNLEVCRVVLPKPELEESLNDRFRAPCYGFERQGLDGWCCFVCGAPPFDQIYGNRYAKAIFLGGWHPLVAHRDTKGSGLSPVVALAITQYQLDYGIVYRYV
jgi:hypothetical protein